MQLVSPFSLTAKYRRLLWRGERALAAGDLVTADEASRLVLQHAGDSTWTRLRAADQSELRVSALELAARVRRERGELRAAADLHTEALSILDGSGATRDNPTRLVAVLLRLGEALRLLGAYAAAETHHRRALALAGQLTPADPLVLAAAHNGLGIVFKDTHRFDEAGAAYRQALAIGQSAGDLHLLADLNHNLAGLAHAEQRFADGEPHARQALALRERAGSLGSTAAAGDLAVLGALLLGQGRHSEAEEVLNAALELWVRRFGDQHYEVAVVKHNLAALHLQRGEYQQAHDAYQEVLTIKRRVLGADTAEVVALQKHIGQLRHPDTGGDRDYGGGGR